MFPPVNRTYQPEFTDFNYWRPAIPDVALPDLTPVSPALSATSDSSRLGLLRNMASGIARRASRQTITSEGSKDAQSQTSRPTSPLVGPSIVAGDGDFDYVSDNEDVLHDQTSSRGASMPGSLPGSFDERGDYLNEEFFDQRYRDDHNDKQRRRQNNEVDLNSDGGYDYDEQAGQSEDDVYPEMFDDDLLATGEMSKVPF
jgi:phosphatidate phosphatase LPIN